MALRIRAQLALGMMAAMLMMGAAALALADDGREARALTNCSVGDYSLDSEEQAFLSLINGYRANNGLGTLTISTNLNRAAHWMANDLGVNAYFSHTDSAGRSPYERAIDCGYPQGAGENIAGGTNWDSAQSAFVAWQNSPGHNANMLGSYYKQIGIARLYVSGSPYGWYWVTNFGATDDGTGGGGSPATNTPTPTNTTAPPTATNTPQATNTPASSTSANTPVPGQPTATPTSTPIVPTPTQGAGAGGASNPPPAPSTPTSTASGPAPANPPPPATPTPTTPAGSLALVPGSANLIGWPGASEDPGQALNSIAGTIEMVFRWDAATRSWERYGPGLPWYVNSLKQLTQGEAYWVITK